MIRNIFIFLGIFLVSNFKTFSESAESTENYVIETIARKASIDLTVKKLSSKPLQGIINRQGKRIFIEIVENEQVHLTEDIDELSYASVKGRNNNFNKIVNYNRKLLTGEVIDNGNLKYSLQNFDSKKIIYLSYETEPKDLYLGLIKSNGDLEKVYKLELIEDMDKEMEYLGITIKAPRTLEFNTKLATKNIGEIVSRSQIVVERPTKPDVSEDKDKYLNVELKLKSPEITLYQVGGSDTLKVKCEIIPEGDADAPIYPDDGIKRAAIFTLIGRMIPSDMPNNSSGRYTGTATLELFIK